MNKRWFQDTAAFLRLGLREAIGLTTYAWQVHILSSAEHLLSPGCLGSTGLPMNLEPTHLAVGGENVFNASSTHPHDSFTTSNFSYIISTPLRRTAHVCHEVMHCLRAMGLCSFQKFLHRLNVVRVPLLLQLRNLLKAFGQRLRRDRSYAPLGCYFPSL